MTHLIQRFGICVLLFGASVAAARAAPFCVEVTGIPPECIYADAVQCSKRALQLAGVCSANPDELLLSPGTGRYCVVGQQRETQCVYADRNTCTQAASQLGGVCIENTRGGVQPNPFADQPNRAY